MGTDKDGDLEGLASYCFLLKYVSCILIFRHHLAPKEIS